ncbi:MULTISPECIES: helix-turn-helix transcriptional regulator [Sinorhizobium]|uniref:AraC family transcriptional regulator n=2 Tax=Sinorhizobium TaxID=28105 RepID=A0A2S3YKX8_9HYPH|nr:MULTISPECIES: helix-turn-helix transcriptional regulator [Sinorhizobium]AUX74963.1 AraC family transcriptional regulator protein [Sinorhizobium fredii]PDT41830.1 AraC family transcriptional regulator [Sinorhizobium sp. FG01]POH28642.1 AraC family transcriptional regulator [Sinorhizobium americanum]
MKHETPPVVAGAVIRQGGRTCLHRLTNTTPVLIHVRSGNKVVVIRDTPLLLTAGEFGLLPDHQPMTMENIPKAPQNYEARILPVPRPLFEETYARLAFITPPRTALPVKALDLPAEAVALFDFCCSPENFSRLPAPVATVRLMELITWFALSGAVLGVQGNPLLQHRLRQMIEAEPARNWTLGQAARSFNMSEATLRRKLAAENTSFTETLSDTRMTRALALLQTTTLPIAHVAQEVGYDSPSQFSARFKERFGINPREVRGDLGIFERIGTEVEQIRRDAVSVWG